MKKLRLLLVGGIGYVLGARAGRQRYEQIRGVAMKVRSNPKVQQTAQHAADTVKEAAPVVKEKVAGAAGAAASKVKSSGAGDTGTGDTVTGANGVPLEESAYPNGMTPPTS